MSRERPILFSGPMVRALLDGRKTQTRRLFTHRHAIAIDYIGPSGDEGDPSNWGYFFDGPDHNGYMVLGRGHEERHDHGRVSIPCPYGEPGDRLWVRETWGPSAGGVVYRAEEYRDGHVSCPDGGRWRPSIHMPRWASRITLEVTDVRVQRLHALSDADAIAEGISPLPLQEGESGCWWTGDPAAGAKLHARTPRAAFAKLWDHINGTRSPWKRNDWVWAVTCPLAAQQEARAA